jgi:ElaB/YqjD/DUF883 family membrane-anchored ribosome-binding protein
MTDPTPAEPARRHTVDTAQLLNLADRAERHTLTGAEAARLREGVAHHCARAEQAEADLAALRRTAQQLQTNACKAIEERAWAQHRAEAKLERVRAELEDQRAARQIAGDCADRFRDVLSEALGHPDENPGDDVLVAELRAHFSKTGPEPTRWRDFCAGALALVDQHNADIRAALDEQQEQQT